MAMTPAVHDQWPCTSVAAPHHTLQRLPSGHGEWSSSGRLSYAEIANGKRTSSPGRRTAASVELPPNDSAVASNMAASASSVSSSISAEAILDVAVGPAVMSSSRLPSSGTTASQCAPSSESPSLAPAPLTAPPPASRLDSAASTPTTSTAPPSTVCSPREECEVAEGVSGVKVLDAWQTAVESLERDNVIREKIGLVVNQRFRIVQKISFGSYGSIYSAVDLQSNEDVAVKFETGAKQNTELHLKYENDVYHNIKGAPGVPRIYWFGSEYDHHILVMQLLGPSLEQLFNYCERHFTWETIVSLGVQMVQRVRNLHSRGFLHRDIKPENFLMGLGDDEKLCFLVDFGLARRYRFRDGGMLTHIPFRKGKNLVGTAKYASLNSHNGMELSRRDDVESLGYIIIEFINRELPWKEQRSKARFRTKQQSYNRIRNIKEQADWSTVCPKMSEWVKYCRGLEFSEEPDYEFLIKLLRALMPAEKAAVSDNFTASDISNRYISMDANSCGASTSGGSPQHRVQVLPESIPQRPMSFRMMGGVCQGRQWMAQSGVGQPPVPLARVGGSCQQHVGPAGGHPGPRWPPHCAPPHQRPLRPNQQQHFYNAASNGGGFACPPPASYFNRFSSNGIRTPFAFQNECGEVDGRVPPVYPPPLTHHQPIGPFGRPFQNHALNEDHQINGLNFDDGSQRYSWLMRRDSSPSQRYTFECLFRWTIPSGVDPTVPPSRRGGGLSFGYGGGGGGAGRNQFVHPVPRNRTRAK